MNLRFLTGKRFLWVGGIILSLAFIPAAEANNLSISSGRLLDQDTSANSIKVECDISWEHSWKDSVNHDAVWIFAKYSIDGGETWNAMSLKGSGINPSGYSAGTGADTEISVPSDKRGMIYRRATNGSGAVTVTDVQFVWDYGADSVSDVDADGTQTLVKIFGIEMVYVTEGGFFAGDGAAGTNGEFEFGSASSVAPAINSESGISFTNATAGGWYYNTDSSTDDEASGTAFEVTASFPKGYQAFYLMKYEITQGQYAEFLNTLSTAQAANRFPGQNGNSRHTVDGTFQNYSAGRPDRACNFLSWMDAAAYADWACLRPMTELEFEKACRGPLSAVTGEYAWGNVSIVAASALSGSENGTETVTTSGAGAHYGNNVLSGGDGSSGPLRAGIFAKISTTRVQAGAGYYGNLDLSGNLWERTVTVGNAAGRSFSGTHGDGVLTTATSYEGNATNADWPGMDGTSASRGVTGATGAGFRGGAWDETTVARLAVSDRLHAALDDSTRRSDSGGRLARTAP